MRLMRVRSHLFPIISLMSFRKEDGIKNIFFVCTLISSQFIPKIVHSLHCTFDGITKADPHCDVNREGDGESEKKSLNTFSLKFLWSKETI